MSFLHKPKKISIAVFSVVVLLYVVCYFVLVEMEQGKIVHTNNFIEFLHSLYPISQALILEFIFAYVVLEIEKLILHLKPKNRRIVMAVGFVSDILIGIVLFDLTTSIFHLLEKNSNNVLQSLPYFCTITEKEALPEIIEYWIAVFFLAAFCFSIFLFFSSRRKYVLMKKTARDIQLGFEYEKSAFYIQTNLPYEKVNQLDGTKGELIAYSALQGLPDGTVQYVFNREIPKPNGLTTEIDLIVLHRNGIVVIENKHYTTQIFGKASDHTLTIIDHNGQTKNIYNPILQNERHVEVLKQYLKSKTLWDENFVPIHSIVVFTVEEKILQMK